MRYIVLFVSLLFVTVAGAATITDYSVDATTAGGPLRATATLSFTNSSLVVILRNNLSNPKSAAQLVSDVIISGLAGLDGNPLLDTTVSLNGTYSQLYGTVDLVDPGWGFGAVAGGYEICIVCPASIHPSGKTAPPSRLIIGSGPNPDGNASIGTHSPSLDGFAQFTINNVNPNSTITGVSISFGSDAVELAATPGPGILAVPEPGAWLMAGGGLVLLMLRRITQRRHT